MTPLLPNPDHYLHNLITMTSSESKRLWRRAIKEHFNCQCVYCGDFMNYNNLQSTMYALNVEVEKMLRRMLYPRVDDVIRKRVVKTGETG